GDGERRSGGRRRGWRHARLPRRRAKRAAALAAIAGVDRSRAPSSARRLQSPRAAGARRPADRGGPVRRGDAVRSLRGPDRIHGGETLMFRNMAYASVSAASAGLLLVLFVIAGRTLGDAEFGKFSFALALGTIFETLMDFGLHQVTIRAVARDTPQATAL